MNILYDEKGKESSNLSETPASGIPYGNWLSSLTFDTTALSLHNAAIPSFSTFTSTAFKFADELTNQLNTHAEKASSQVKEEFAKTRADREAQMKLLQQSRTCSLPWETEDESKAILSDHVMQQVLQLPSDERNFSEPPTALQVLPFNFPSHVPIILRMLEIDHNLKSVHARLAPKANEETLWQNYFRRVKYLRIRAGIDEDVAGLAALSEEAAGVFLKPKDTVPSTVSDKSKGTVSKSSNPTAIEGKMSEPLPRSDSRKESELQKRGESSSTPSTPLGMQSASSLNITPRSPALTAGGRLLQELDEIISPSTPPKNSYASQESSSKYITPAPKVDNIPRKHEDEDDYAYDHHESEDDIALDDLDLEDLDDYSDIDGLDEAELEAEIERELLEDD